MIFALYGHTGACHTGKSLPRDIVPAYGRTGYVAIVAAET